jgi:Xaa-Pro aminopeptidase
MSEETTKKRPHDVPTPAGFAELMKSGWIPTPLDGIKPTPPLKYCVTRREALSKAFPGVRLVIPAGNYKVRSNDSDYAYRPHSAFAYYTGVQGV